MKNEKVVRNSIIAFLAVIIIAVLVTIPLWTRDAGQGVQVTEAAPQEEKVATPENTIMDSRTGQVVFIPESDPENVDYENTIMESRTGQIARVPTSDPEQG